MMVSFFLLLFFIICVNSNKNVITPELLTSSAKVKMFAMIDKTFKNQCGTDLKLYISSLQNMDLWALKMFDASAKPSPGLLEGNPYQVGSFDECVGIAEVLNGHEIIGKYCNVVIKPNQNFRYGNFDLKKIFSHFGVDTIQFIRGVFDICIPKSCSSQELNSFWGNLTQGLNPPVQIYFDEKLCQYKDKPIKSDATDFFVFTFFAIVTSVVFCSTLYDLYLQQNEVKLKTSQKILLIFSIYTNSKKLFSTHVENEKLSCLYGIKVISMLWIISGHMGVIKTIMGATDSLLLFSDWNKYWHNTFFLGTFFAVETYFLIGGLLVSYLQLKYTERFRINLFMFYFHRILRLSPALFAVILIYLSVIKYLGDGPFWSLMLSVFVDCCRKTWWATFFFVSNFLHPMKQCMTQAWYLSVDTQLYFVAPLVIMSLKKHPGKVMTGMVVACLICVVYSFVLTMNKNFGSILFFESDIEFMTEYYFTPVAHLPSWLFGILLGYLLHHQNFKRIIISKRKNLTFWAVSLLLMLALNLMCTILIRNGRQPFSSALFNSFNRPIWSMAVCFIIFSCSTGNGGLINTFLSHPVFLVLGKLTYCMFLTHPVVLAVVFVGIKRQPTTLNTFINFIEMWGILVLVLVSSTILSLVFEAPVLNFLQILAKSDYSRKRLNEGYSHCSNGKKMMP